MAKTYLEIDSKDETYTEPIDIVDALVCGYVSGLYGTRTYSNIFFLEGNKLRSAVEHEIMDLETQIGDRNNAFTKYCRACMELYRIPKFVSVRKHQLAEAFIAGYTASIHRAGKFDWMLFAEDYEQMRALIFVNLLSVTKKNEDALRAAARIVGSHSTGPKNFKQFRAMLSDKDDPADEDDQPTDGQPTQLNSEIIS